MLNNYKSESSPVELKQLVERYPYDQSAWIDYLTRLIKLGSETLDDKIRTSSLFVPDRKVLYYMIEGYKYAIKPINEGIAEKRKNPKENSSSNAINIDAGNTDRTLTLIDGFLIKMPDGQPKRRMTLADAATDYATYLAQQYEMEEAGHASDNVESQMQDTDPVPVDGEYTRDRLELVGKTENTAEILAKKYIQQGKFEDAIEIMQRLNANNPKKSCYFADQIRFLEKVVINNKNKK